MKNKIAKKLIFSAVALGASVLTLTTTTYAWYVQNNTVTATQIIGQTASNDAGSLFITKDARYGVTPQWGPKFEASDDDFTSDAGKARGNAKEGFTPVVYVPSAGKFKDVNNDDVSANSENPSVQGKILVYNFWLLSNRSTGVNVRPTLTVQNTTSSKTAQTAYAAVKNNATPQTNLVNEGEQFWVDAVQALRMRIQTFDMDENETIANPDTTDTEHPTIANPNYHKYTVADVSTIYDVLQIAKKPKGASDTDFANYELATAGDSTKSIDESQLGSESVDSSVLFGAHAYYKKFVGKNAPAGWESAYTVATPYVDNTDPDHPVNKMNTFAVGDKPKLVTITIWLEGTDISCFDSCSGQTFNFGFDFTVASAS